MRKISLQRFLGEETWLRTQVRAFHEIFFGVFSAASIGWILILTTEHKPDNKPNQIFNPTPIVAPESS